MAETGKSFIKKFVGFSIATWFSFLLGFITAPISTRLFNPDVLGKINIFNTYTSLFGLLTLVGLDQAYARFYIERPNGKSKGYLFTFCFAITYAIIFVFVLIAIPFRNWLSWNLFQETDNLLVILFFITIFCSATLRYLNLTYRMEQNIKMFTIQGILMAVVSKTLYICVGFWNPSYKPALIVLCFSNVLLSAIFLFIQRNCFELIVKYDKVFSKEIFKFALPLIPVSILSWANSAVPQIVMQHTMDYYSIGIFSSAMALANMILVVQSGFNTFWVPYTFENYKTQNGQFFKVHRYLICVLTILALCIVCSQDIIFLLLGEKYRAAKNFFPFLILGPTCFVAGEVGGIGIEISKKTYLKLIVFAVSIVVNIVACYVLSKPFGVPGIAMATSLAAIIAMFLKTILGEKFYKVITNYKYVVFCLLAIIASAAATLWIPKINVRLFVTIVILLIAIVFYWTEIKELWKVALSYFKK